MLPIILHPQNIKALVIGKGSATDRRIQMLKDAGVAAIKYFETPPSEKEFDDINLVYIADFDDEVSAKLYDIALKRNLLVNIEDKKPFCNFHVPAITRRGELLITVSTGASAPRMARRLKRIFEKMFPLNWGEGLKQLSQKREELKKEGYKFETMAPKLDEEIEKLGLLKQFDDWKE